MNSYHMDSVKALEDPVILNDDRVLDNLLSTEDRLLPSPSIFTCSQHDVKEYMRKVVSNWMLEVCEEQKCEDDVFPLAMNYLDRVLSVMPLRRNQLQLLGAVSMLIASKLKETAPLSSEKLVQYTDNSITIDELMDWELLVLNKLKWNLSAITPNDFLEQILLRLPLDKETSIKVRNHAQTFIALCATEFKFAICSPSMVACGSICVAIGGILGQTFLDDAHIVQCLHRITQIDMDYIKGIQEQVQNLLYINSNAQMTDLSSANDSNVCKNEPGQPTTPTDVRDICC